MSTIAEQVKNHMAYGEVDFKSTGIEESDQFSHWSFDSDGSEWAVFIDGSKLLIGGTQSN